MGLDQYTAFYKSAAGDKKPKKVRSATQSRANIWRILALIIVVVVAGMLLNSGDKKATNAPVTLAEKSSNASDKSASKTTASPGIATAPTASNDNPCAGNKLDKLALVSISKRHMWACVGNKSVHDSPVITGMQSLAADLTPPGTYQIYSKQKDVTLTGSDSTGSWNDPASYWMPFLTNEHGVYGFHDATWRKDSEFGNIDPYSMDGSHGCIEMPLADTQWLYNWSPTGTTVTIKN